MALMRYGDILPEDFYIPKSAFWIQKDLTVHNPFEELPISAGDVVMDCGGFIGTFTAAAVEQGAQHVTCYEALPKNAEQCRQNVARYGDRVTVVEAAITADDNETATLSLSGFSGANSLLPSSNRIKTLQVRAVNFRREVLRIQPTVLKLDIEGAEYVLLASLLPGDLASVAAMFIEFHPIEGRDERILAIRRYLKAEGFRLLNGRRRAFTVVRA